MISHKEPEEDHNNRQVFMRVARWNQSNYVAYNKPTVLSSDL